MQITRYCGHSITSENWQNFILRDFKSHNMIVLLLALANNLVSIMRLIIESMDDPFLRAIEFALRANIFRNIILGLEVILYSCRRKWDFCGRIMISCANNC